MSKIGAYGGMSRTTSYLVQFDRDFGNKEPLTLMCDEAQLPNVQSATAQMAGRFQGEGPYQYPHTRLYTDVSLGFLCDANLTQLKFFQTWYDSIFLDSAINEFDNPQRTDGVERLMQKAPKTRERRTRLAYPENYTTTTRITKVELGPHTRTPIAHGYGDRASISYLLEGSYPYAIDAVPLSYGSSQITRVTVNFHYVRHTIVYVNKEPYNPFTSDGTTSFGDRTPTSASLTTGP
tara:strand:- start:362 stop:1066 length:705 start_codon:yes stop_codon:yes gene_type:complete